MQSVYLELRNNSLELVVDCSCSCIPKRGDLRIEVTELKEKGVNNWLN